jgi:hypothetical protein
MYRGGRSRSASPEKDDVQMRSDAKLLGLSDKGERGEVLRRIERSKMRELEKAEKAAAEFQRERARGRARLRSAQEREASADSSVGNASRSKPLSRSSSTESRPERIGDTNDTEENDTIDRAAAEKRARSRRQIDAPRKKPDVVRGGSVGSGSNTGSGNNIGSGSGSDGGSGGGGGSGGRQQHGVTRARAKQTRSTAVITPVSTREMRTMMTTTTTMTARPTKPAKTTSAAREKRKTSGNGDDNDNDDDDADAGSSSPAGTYNQPNIAERLSSGRAHTKPNTSAVVLGSRRTSEPQPTWASKTAHAAAPRLASAHSPSLNVLTLKTLEDLVQKELLHLKKDMMQLRADNLQLKKDIAFLLKKAPHLEKALRLAH